MKRIILLSFLTLFVSGNIFAQLGPAENLSNPVDTFHNFWSMALSNNFEGARNFVIGTSQDQELKDKQSQDSFQIIFQNKLRFPELDKSQILPASAYFNFQIEAKEKKNFRGQTLLIKQGDEWKIVLFDITPVSEIYLKTSPGIETNPFFKPRIIPGLPVRKKCSICG